MTESLDRAYAEHQRFLWGLCYRMTGSSADADELLQETFVRAIERPPRDRTKPWGPWLTTIATRLAIDRLRTRRRRDYVGPWLPTLIETEIIDPQPDITARYGYLESMTIAFLLVVEALKPRARAVLLLRDVFDYSVEETAEALGLTAANTKVIHHRARATMESYDKARVRPATALSARSQAALQTFLVALMQGDRETTLKMLRDDVRMRSDGGGEFIAARKPIFGNEKVSLFFHKISQQVDPAASFEMRVLNGLPALVARFPNAAPPYAPVLVISIDIDDAGLIREIYSVQATAKLRAIG